MKEKEDSEGRNIMKEKEDGERRQRRKGNSEDREIVKEEI